MLWFLCHLKKERGWAKGTTTIFSLLLTVAMKITHPVVSLSHSVATFAVGILLLLWSCVLLVISWIGVLLEWGGKQVDAGKKQYSENLQLQRNFYWYFIISQ